MEPTITDAQAALGRLIPDYFAGGRFALNAAAAREAIRRRLSAKLGMSVEKAATGVLALADLQMVQALRLVTVQRGLDPRDFVLVTFGGAGPMHAASLLRELGAKRAIIPPEAGVQSAWGLLVAERRRDYQRASVGALARPYLAQMRGAFAALNREAAVEFGSHASGGEPEERRLAMDLRYRGQAYEIAVECPEAVAWDGIFLAEMAARFHRRHRQLYGFAEESRPIEFMAARLAVLNGAPRQKRRSLGRHRQPLRARRWREILAYFDDRYHSTQVFRREDLGAGDRLAGPAIVAQAETTTVIPPWAEAEVNGTGDLVLKLK